ncbi:GIY-YIG nuclease family protein [uncultured Polaribacter sp.]|uniref:GIY-YIG nuclease family protein n=1 Tax=uncultured Polaribacter sp. TaxID=174711 RepID=UPI002617BD4F|nr:GIY-YIG nuclease family protein [uncultured Polaribacter sp.]
MFTIYILFSEKLQKHYVGYTKKTVDERLEEHLYNHKGFTSNTKDWKLIYHLETNTKSEALKLERKIKKRGAKRYLNDIASR